MHTITKCRNCGDGIATHLANVDNLDACGDWHPTTIAPDYWPARVVIRKDFDHKYAATWPSEIVRNGHSAGAGRHDSIATLVAAIEAKGYEVERATGRSLLVRPVEVPASWAIDGFTIEGVRVSG